LRVRSYFIQSGTIRDESYQVTPFGNSRVTACLRLSETYRSLPRPSSPASAKASTTYPIYLALLNPLRWFPREPKWDSSTYFLETIWSQLLALCKIVFYPIYSCQRTSKIRNFYRLRMVGRTGLEPVTPALSRRCSNQLSYMPADHRWWRLGDSNS
jgi:hypothetical protein